MTGSTLYPSSPGRTPTRLAPFPFVLSLRYLGLALLGPPQGVLRRRLRELPASKSAYPEDIEGGLGSSTKIIEVGKLNPQGLTWEVFRWNGAQWTGDFTIDLGDGIYLRTIQDFSWTPKLLTPAVV